MKKGLTLIEVMVAALIFSFISAALYMLLRTGISVRKKVESKQGTYQNINLNLENIALALRNVVLFRNDSVGFLGGVEDGGVEDGGVNLEFYTQVFDYQEARPKVSLVKYRFQGGILYKESREPFEEAQPQEPAAVEIIDNLEKFEVTYYDGAGAETGEWSNQEQVPQGVKIRLEYKDEKGRPQVMKKHVFIYRGSEAE